MFAPLVDPQDPPLTTLPEKPVLEAIEQPGAVCSETYLNMLNSNGGLSRYITYLILFRIVDAFEYVDLCGAR